ncbi:MAG: DUF1080 domain-containing protein [Rikenellaceae bacterium]
MRKILSILILCFAVCSLYAQSPANRIPKTIVADVLAQMPTQNEATYNQMMADLVSSGEEGILILTSMIAAPGEGDNTSVSFAIGGLAYYVSAEERKSECELVTKAFTKALEKSNDEQTKAFLIRMLQITGRDDVIETMKKYAQSKDLYEEAINALSYINTPASRAAIIEIEPKVRDKKVIAQVAGEREITELTPLLIEWYSIDEPQLHKAVTHALSKMSDAAAFELLAENAAKIGYSYDDYETTAAFMLSLKNQPIKVAKKYASNIQSASKNAAIRAQATAIVLKANEKKSAKLVATTISDDSRVYRNNVLDLCCLYDKEELAKLLISKFNKYNTQTQNDIINWFKERGIESAIPTVAQCLTSDDADLRKDAMAYMVSIGSDESIATMLSLLESDDASIVNDMTNAMLWSDKKNFGQAVNNASQVGKIATLDFLTKRKVAEMVPFINENLENSDDEIQDLAYKALVNCATAKDIDNLFVMINSVDNKHLPYVQKAIGLQLADMPTDKALGYIKKNSSKVDKEKLIILYSYIPTKESVATLRTLYKNEKGGVKKAVATALINWSNTDALDDIYTVAADSEMGSLNKAAVQNSISLINKSTMTDVQKFLTLRRLMSTTNDTNLQKQIISSIGACNTFNALVFVAPYMDNETLAQDAATAVYTIALKDKNYQRYGANIEAMLTKFSEIRTGGDAGYERQAVADYIAAAPKGEAGFVEMFNGETLDGWKGYVADPIPRSKMSKAQLSKAQAKVDATLNESWVIKDGELHFTGHGSNLCSDKIYGDFEMYVDWKIYYENEQSRRDGDAGIYLRGAPQVQIWDTCRVNVGAQVGSGGLYNNTKNISKPLVMADNKIGEWNTFYIKMVGERVTVYLNGQLVTDNVILENYFDRGIPIFTEEQIELQAHGSLVAYRDIYIKELEKVEPLKLSAAEQKEGFKLLFDGISMNEWQGNTKDYVAENGTITLYPKNGGGGNLYSKNEYSNFVLRFEFQLTDAANNGLGIRTPLQGDAAYVGMELQILDNEHPVYKDLSIYQYHGSVYGVAPSKRGFLKPTGEWNVQEVIANGDQIKITLNGEVILDCNIREASEDGKATIDGQSHPGLLNEKGYLAFLGHGSKVSFKNIRIKELK